MKHIKTFEEKSLKYNIGDIVCCTDTQKVQGSDLDPSKKYKVVDISKFGGVTVEDIETGQLLGQYDIDRFKLEIDFDASKYNL